MPAEIFPSDLQRCIDFYTRILRFELARHEPEDGYAYFVRDAVRIGAAVKDTDEYPDAAKDPQARFLLRNWLTCAELVLEVDDLEAERAHVVGVASDAAAITDIVLQEWGLRDFRLRDPDGYYIRITEHAK